MIANHRLKQWQEELDRLAETTGITLEQVNDYLGLTYQKSTGFYVKIPRKRKMFIGIGMAFRESVDTVNRWIVHYGGKKQLYSKDLSEDLIWIYLIQRNRREQDPGINYYEQYEHCQELAFQTYMTYWNELISGSLDTADVDKSLSRIEYGDEFSDLENFVAENMDSFKTAYAKPRRMLATYVSSILTTNAKSDQESKYDTLGSLRGWLDDSMINYLAGSVETINVSDQKQRVRTSQIKHVPKSKRTHTALALALGMTRDEIDQYLKLMGYGPLDEEVLEEGNLIQMLTEWEKEHPLQQVYIDRYIHGDESIVMDVKDEVKTVSEMLMLRQELKAKYDKRRMRFPYLKE